jgi:hypothetical protein
MKRIIPSKRDRHLIPDSDFLPHASPLERVVHGSWHDGHLCPGRHVDPRYPGVLSDCLRIAQRLILHPRGIAATANIVGNTLSPDVLVERGIRKILAAQQWVICLDNKLEGGAFYDTPSRPSWFVSAAENMIFLRSDVGSHALLLVRLGKIVDKRSMD